jgi:hypothetical protein
MEMAAISGRNSALLATQYLAHKQQQRQQQPPQQQEK